MSFFQIDRRSIANFDPWLFMAVVLIGVLGVINLASASAGTGLWKAQAYWLVMGMGVMGVVLLIDYKRFEQLAPLIYAGALALLVGLHFFARTISGARSWYDLGFAHLQPSELAKIALIILFARIYHRDTQQTPWGFRELVWPVLLAGAPIVSIMLEPDMGTALVIMLLMSTMAFFAGLQRRLVVIVLVAIFVVAASYPAWKQVLKPHQRSRIEVFIHPEKDPLGAGYNALQSKIAVGSGGMTGKGFKQGNVHMLRFLPEQQTDFAFSVWAEEWGFVWVFLVLGTYIFILLRGMDAVQEAKDRFGVMLAVGCTALLFWHIFINISMVVGIFPVIGVPLPFMSYGGSNLITFMIAVGLIVNVRMRKYFF